MEKTKKEEIIDYLRQGIESTERWVYRKEIAAWSSILLYFTALFGAYKLISDLQGYLYLSIGVWIVFALFSYLFGLFLFKQYGSLAYGMANIRALSYWMTRILANDIKQGLDFTNSIKNTVPAFVQKMNAIELKKIRQCCILCKLTIPFRLFFKIFYKPCGKNKKWEYDTLEVQEAILYNMIIISTLSLLAYAYIINNVMANHNSVINAIY